MMSMTLAKFRKEAARGTPGPRMGRVTVDGGSVVDGGDSDFDGRSGEYAVLVE